MNLYFTSDTHFNHKRLAERRGYSIEEMNEILINNWNNRIKPDDHVYHLGDFALGRVADCVSICERLNGYIYLIRGNHEKVAERQKRFVWIKDYHRIKINDQKIYLLHYPMLTWNCMHHGSWHLHGHSHGGLTVFNDVKRLDVGVDTNNLTPYHYDEVKVIMDTRIIYEPRNKHY